MRHSRAKQVSIRIRVIIAFMRDSENSSYWLCYIFRYSDLKRMRLQVNTIKSNTFWGDLSKEKRSCMFAPCIELWFEKRSLCYPQSWTQGGFKSPIKNIFLDSIRWRCNGGNSPLYNTEAQETYSRLCAV